jgi:nucleoside-diphosphate-sugar epimerase
VRIVVTGACGTIGRQLAAELADHGHDVVGVDNSQDPPPAGRFIRADLSRPEQVESAMRGTDALAHLARIPFPYTTTGYDPTKRTWQKPDFMGDAEKFNLNLAITFNVLSAARAFGVRKIVMGSSFAVYGLYYPSRPRLPDYLPIDESHLRKPDDPYGLTKLLGETLADAYVDAAAVQIASLRLPGVSRESPESIAARQRDPMVRGIGGLWTYIDRRDAALACRLALEANFVGHEAFNICAPTTFLSTPTDELVRHYLPSVPCRRPPSDTNWAGYDSSKAARMLGFNPRHQLTSPGDAVSASAR